MRLLRAATMTGLVGAVVEAWIQLRIGRLRVLLSLIGVGVAVAAMTFVIAFGQLSVAIQEELTERWTGRAGTVQAFIQPMTGEEPSDAWTGGPGPPAGAAGGPDQPEQSEESEQTDQTEQTERIIAAQHDFVERYQVSHWATFYDSQLRLDLAGSPYSVSATVVSGGYGLIHRVEVEQGRWFRAEDADDLSPSLVVSSHLLQTLGIDELTEPVTVTGLSPARTTYTIVGVLRTDPNDQYCESTPAGGMSCATQLKAYVLGEAYERALPASQQPTAPTLEVWAGSGRGTEMTELMTHHFDALFGRGATQAQSNEFTEGQDIGRMFTLVVTGAGVFVMILGALGLVNISLVTVRQRIHEIGVRRSFGATSRRIFFSIMLESVVATVVAGVVGIALAIVAIRVVPLDYFIGYEPSVRPPFPISAALIGLTAACGVGALAGIVPALVAVRIRPIDAIRF